MIKTILIGVAAAGLVGVTTAAAQSSSSQTPPTTSPSDKSSMPSDKSSLPSDKSSTATSPSSQSSTSASDKSSGSSQSASSQTGTTATASAGSELSGELKKIDKDKKSVKISSSTGGEQELKIGSGATITRDGTQAGLEQLKEGDQVRASFDPSSKQATKLEVMSKDMKDKQGSSKPDEKSDKSDQPKSDSKKY
jgi:Cu/Ag efflux protein CusF